MEIELSPTGIYIIISVAVILVIAIEAFVYFRKRRAERLRSQVGAEYDRTVQERGSQGRGEAELEKRKKRVAALHIRPLGPEDRNLFIELWRGVQARFVDTPEGAVIEADQLVRDVMAARGYPVTEFEQRAEDISVRPTTLRFVKPEGRPAARIYVRPWFTIGHYSMSSLASQKRLRRN